MAVRVALGAWLLAVTSAATAAAAPADYDSGYVWMANASGGITSIIYGSPESPEDLLFWVTCNGPEKITAMTVYVDIAETEMGQKLPIELAGSTDKLLITGKVATDEMSGFHFAEAEKFEVRPVIALLAGKGAVTVKTGTVSTTLPEKGRGKATAKFAKSCPLD